MKLTPLQIYKAPVSSPNQPAAKPQQRKTDVGFSGIRGYKNMDSVFWQKGKLIVQENLKYLFNGVDEYKIFDDVKLVKNEKKPNSIILVNNKKQFDLECNYNKYDDSVNFKLADSSKDDQLYNSLKHIGERSIAQQAFKKKDHLFGAPIIPYFRR